VDFSPVIFTAHIESFSCKLVVAIIFMIALGTWPVALFPHMFSQVRD